MIKPDLERQHAPATPARLPRWRATAALTWVAAHPRYARWAAAAWLTILSLIALFQASLVVNGRRYFWLDDDQMISMRYARHLVTGHGLVWNPGQYVEGYTNFLWTLLMAVVHLLPVGDAHTALVVEGINWTLALAVLFLSERLLRLLLPKPGLALTALLATLVVDLDVIYWSVHGFETTLLTVTLLLVLARILEEWHRGRPRMGTYVLMGVLPLIRADAYALWAAAALLTLGLSENRRRTAGLLALSLLLPGAQLLWRHWYYGSWLPNTYYLKVAGVPGRGRLALMYLARFGRHYSVPLGFALAGVFLNRDTPRRLLAAGFLFTVVYVLYVGEDVFRYSRFFAPLVPLLLVLAVIGIVEVTRRRLILQALLLSAVFVSVLVMVGTTRLSTLDDPNGLPQEGLVTGLLIRQFTRPHATIAVVAAGNVSYFSHRVAVDMLGKSDAHIAHEPAHAGGYIGHDKFDPTYSLSLGPDLVVPFWTHDWITDPAAVARAALSGDRYLAAIAANPTFRRDYLPNPVRVPYLMQHNTVYVRRTSPELARRRLWRQPRLGAAP